MQRNLSKMLFEDKDPLNLYLEEFKASNTGNNIESVNSKEDNKDDKKEDNDSEDNKEEKHYGYKGLGDEIRDVLDKHNESFFTLKDILSEENASVGTQEKDSEESSSQEQKDNEDSEASEKKKKLGDELDIDDLIGEKSVSHANLLKVSDLILKRIKATPAIAKMIKTFSKYDPESMDEKQEEFLKTYVEKLTKDNPEGMIDRASLKSFLTKSVNVPKVGKTIVNPMQTKSGRPQKVGVEPVDLDFYKQFKIIPFFLNYEGEGGQLQTVSGHQGNSDYMVLFLAPAFGAVIENDMQLDLYRTLFPTYTSQVGLEKGHLIIDIDELPFVYIKDIDELKKAQTSFKSAINALASKAGSRKSDGKESEQDSQEEFGEDNKKSEQNDSVYESFIYRQGLSLLINEDNRSMDVMKFINVAAPNKPKDKTEEIKLNSAAERLISEKSSETISDAYKSYLEVEKIEYSNKRKEKSEEKANAISDAITAFGSVASGSMKGFMAYGALGSIGGSFAAGTIGMMGLTMLPYVAGLTVAMPALTGGAALGTKAFSSIKNMMRDASLNKKELDEQIKIVLKDKVSSTSFKSVGSESAHLKNAIMSAKNTLVKDREDESKGVRKDSEDLYKITTKDFLSLCSKHKVAFTEISDISSSKEKQRVFKNFLIRCNKILNVAQIEIDEVAKLEIQEKTGESGLLQKDIDFDNKDSMKGVIDKLRESIKEIEAETPAQKAMMAALLAALDMGNLDEAISLIKEMNQKPVRYQRRTERFLRENEKTSEEDLISAAAKEMNVSEESVRSGMESLNKKKISQKQINALVEIQSLLFKKLNLDLNNSMIEKTIKNNDNILVYDKESDLSEDDAKRGNISVNILLEFISLPKENDKLKSLKTDLLDGKIVIDNSKSFFDGIKELLRLLVPGIIYDKDVKEFYKQTLPYIAKDFEKLKDKKDYKASAIIIRDIEQEVKKIVSSLLSENRTYYKNSLSRLLFEMKYDTLNFNN